MALSVTDAETQLNNHVSFHASLVAQYQAKYQTMETTALEGLKGEDAPRSAAALTAYRNKLNSLMSRQSVQELLGPPLLQLAEAVGAPSDLSVSQVFFFLRKYYNDTPRTIQSRDITFDVAFSVSGTGTGELVRLVTDFKGKQIEAVHVESAKTCECVADQGSLGPSGRHNEKFRIEGQPLKSGDSINEVLGTKSGSLGIGELTTTGTESKILKNGNLTSKLTTGTTTTMFTNWTLDSTTGVAVDTTVAHIANFGKTPVSAKISAATRSLTQRLPKLATNRPYLPFLAYKRDTGAAPAGTQIDIAWGSKSQTLTMSGSETGWNYWIPDRDLDLWSKNFYADESDFVVSVPTLASGYINISMIHFFPMIKIGGTYWAIIPGATPFQLDDNYGTIADSFTSSDSILQRYLVYGFGEYLNHSGTPDLSDLALP